MSRAATPAPAHATALFARCGPAHRARTAEIRFVVLRRAGLFLAFAESNRIAVALFYTLRTLPGGRASLRSPQHRVRRRARPIDSRIFSQSLIKTRSTCLA